VRSVDVLTSLAKMVELAERFGEGVAHVVSDDELKERIDRLPTELSAHGVDSFGFDPGYLKRVIGFGAWVYRSYFRCETVGVENIPTGRCFLVANHSGQLPFDGAMITMAVFLERDPPRFPRSMVERFVPATPFVSPFLSRCGQILGTPDNCRRLLSAEESILVFPEGVRGLNKGWGERYRLQRFGQGFMRLAIEMDVPIVPCAVIGAEEQAPTLFHSKSLGKALGFPTFPVALNTLIGGLPLPVKYHIRFGDPLSFGGNANDEDQVIMAKVEEVKAALQAMVDQGLSERQGIFF